MNKYEQLIEYIINEQDDKARELFHQIVVEKSRDIYENLIDEEDFDESVGGNQVERLAGDIQSDEQGMQEADDEFGDDDMGSDTDDMGGDMGGDDMGGDDMGGDFGGGDMGGEGTPEERISDLETALDDLKAEFDALMAGEEEESEHSDMFGGDTDDMGDDEEVDFDLEEPADESFMREYVETVAKPAMNTEGGAIGAKGDGANVNKQSIVAKPNRMGGSSGNIVKGGTEQAADGKPTPTPSNEYTKKRGELKGAGSFENVPVLRPRVTQLKLLAMKKPRAKKAKLLTVSCL